MTSVETVQVWVVDRQDRVLQQRKFIDRKGQPGQFGVSAGGRCDKHESAPDSCARLLQDELGLSVPAAAFRILGQVAYKDERLTICGARHDYALANLTLRTGVADEARAQPLTRVLADWQRDGPYTGRRELACRYLGALAHATND